MNNVTYLPIDALIPYASNARTHSDDQVKQIAASIREFGFNNPVLIDKQNGIIAGHGRVLAAKLLGIEEVPTICLDHLSKSAKRAYILADNKISMNSGWNDSVLASEVQRIIDDNAYNITELGFKGSEVDNLLAEIAADEEQQKADHIEPADDEEPATQAKVSKAKSRFGDIWILGNHRVMCGDSVSVDDVAALMDNQHSELLFTSPPYSDMRIYDGKSDLSVDNLINFIPTYKPHCDYQVVNLGLQRRDHEIVEYWQDYIKAAKDCGLKLLSWNVWDKTQAGNIASATSMFAMVHEWLFVFGSEIKRLNRTVKNNIDGMIDRYGEEAISAGKIKSHVRESSGDIHPTTSKTYTHHQLHSVVNIKPENGTIRSEHPATYPVKLPYEYILAMTERGSVVIYPFLGSGTTLIAAEDAGRDCYGMEISPVYVDVIIRRWQAYTQQSAFNLATGATFDETEVYELEN